MRYRRFIRTSSFLLAVVALGALASAAHAALAKTAAPVYFEVADGSHPHDVAAAPDAWRRRCITPRSAPANSASSIRRPARSRKIPLGPGSAPHGVIVGPDGAPWITDSGQNAIVRVDPKTREVRGGRCRRIPLCESQHRDVRPAKGRIWFTGQNGYLRTARSRDRRHEGVESPARSRAVRHHDHAEWRGLLRVARRQSHRAHRCRNRRSDRHRTADAGRRARGASGPIRSGRIWVSYWNTGQVGMYDPATRAWREWKLPGDQPHAYSVWVDDQDKVWLTEWSTNAIVRFDPVTREVRKLPVESRRTPPCGRCSAVRAKRGARNRESIGW